MLKTWMSHVQLSYSYPISSIWSAVVSAISGIVRIIQKLYMLQTECHRVTCWKNQLVVYQYNYVTLTEQNNNYLKNGCEFVYIVKVNIKDSKLNILLWTINYFLVTIAVRKLTL